jgi:hypothetical protein
MRSNCTLVAISPVHLAAGDYFMGGNDSELTGICLKSARPSATKNIHPKLDFVNQWQHHIRMHLSKVAHPSRHNIIKNNYLWKINWSKLKHGMAIAQRRDVGIAAPGKGG